MLSGIHFLLSYACNFECDHCFLYCSPRATGTFSLNQVSRVLDEAVRIGSIEWIYFEGGEPLMFYPLLLESIRKSREKGFKTGIVSNCYLSTTEDDVAVWLKPLQDAGLDYISVSNDAFHFGENTDTPSKRTVVAARKLGIDAGSIEIEQPRVEEKSSDSTDKGDPVIGGGALFKGRAVEKLIQGLPRRPFKEFTRCTHEELVRPKRVHIDAYGNVHLCQGISLGDMWRTPLSELVEQYRADSHPISGPLSEGGPVLLAERHGLPHEESYVDECHCCYCLRKDAIDRFPDLLTPKQVYGL